MSNLEAFRREVDLYAAEGIDMSEAVSANLPLIVSDVVREEGFAAGLSPRESRRLCNSMRVVAEGGRSPMELSAVEYLVAGSIRLAMAAGLEARRNGRDVGREIEGAVSAYGEICARECGTAWPVEVSASVCRAYAEELD